MAEATHEDANLILRLYELRRETTMREARQWLTGEFSADSLDEFTRKCPPGSRENAYFRMVTSYWDMAGLFVVSGVLDQEMFIRSSGESIVVWERVRPFIGELRETFKNPMFLKNLETVAEAGIASMRENAPGAYETFLGRVIRRQ